MRLIGRIHIRLISLPATNWFCPWLPTMWKRSILLWPKDKNVSHTLLRVKKTIERQNGKERPFFHTLSQREYSNIIICSTFETRIQQSNRRRNYRLLFLLPKQLHNLSLIFFFSLLSSYLAKEVISCKAKYNHGTLFLSYEHTSKIHLVKIVM